jgi:protein-disulfide isomerase-like protein with CxxC motif
MKKAIPFLFIIVLSNLPASCVDPTVQAVRAPQLIQYFEGLDRQTAQAIQGIIRDINTAHETIEKQNKEQAEQIKELDKQYYLTEQEMLFNQVVINQLHAIAVDSINNEAILQNSKKTIKEIINSYMNELEDMENRQ